MNRILTLTAAGLALLAGCSKQPSASAMERGRATAYQHCMASAQNENTGLPLKTVENYCTCAADKIVTQLSVADVMRIYRASDEAASKELEPILQECIDGAVEEASAQAG